MKLLELPDGTIVNFDHVVSIEIKESPEGLLSWIVDSNEDFHVFIKVPEFFKINNKTIEFKKYHLSILHKASMLIIARAWQEINGLLDYDTWFKMAWDRFIKEFDDSDKETSKDDPLEESFQRLVASLAKLKDSFKDK